MKIHMVFLVVITIVSMLFPAAAPAERYALLVGCTEYPFLEQDLWLEGPSNDVALMQQVLQDEDFGFQPQNIRILSGWPEDKRARPTRANIETAFRQLTGTVEAGDQIVILMAGHGSRQPADPDPRDVEPDGLDEIFLPADAKNWNMSQQQVENAISDDEIRLWLAELQAKGAFVWILFDACHSGTMVRGDAQERSRHIPIETLIPAGVLQQHEAGREQMRGQQPDNGILGVPDEAGEIVAMYAAQSFEQAPEGTYPLGSDTVHGLFTYTLTKVLTESQSPVTYRELAERVTAQYRSVSRHQPTPLIEGGALDRLVLGEDTLTRPKMLLKGKDWDHPGQFLLHAGALHGLQRGTILTVYPPAGARDADTPVGHVEIISVSPLLASVKPVEFEGMAPPSEDHLLSGSRCEIAFADYGELRLKIAVQTRLETPRGGVITPPEQGAGRAALLLEDTLDILETDHQFSTLVQHVEHHADWFVRVRDKQIVLIPVSGFATDVPPQFTIGSVSDTPEVLSKHMKDALLTIARAQNLMQIATRGSQRRVRGAANVKVDVDILFFENELAEGTVVPPGSRVFREGDLIAFQVKNPSRRPVDVTLLIVNSSYGITSFYPLSGSQEDNRLAPGESFITPLGEIERGKFGSEQLVVIAVGVDQTQTQRINFACLEQTALERARSGTRGAAALNSPLGQLLETALYGEDAGRGVPRASLGNYALRMVNWRTAPGE